MDEAPDAHVYPVILSKNGFAPFSFVIVFVKTWTTGIPGPYPSFGSNTFPHTNAATAPPSSGPIQ